MIDEVSKQRVSKWFESRGWKVSNTDEYCRYDLVVEKGDEHWIVEIKERTFNSCRFGDNIIEYSKLESYGEQNACVVNIFTDCTYIVNVKKPHTLITTYAPATTSFENRRYVKKVFASWDHSICKRIEL